MIETRDLWVRFGAVAAVRGLSFRAEPGGWTALIGPNGAGKTSALRALAGLAAYEGEVLHDGRDVRRLGRRAVARLVAYVPQKPETPPALTVAEYVLLGRTPHIPYLGGESRHDREAAASALQRLELEGFAERPLGSLSGGPSRCSRSGSRFRWHAARRSSWYAACLTKRARLTASFACHLPARWGHPEARCHRSCSGRG